MRILLLACIMISWSFHLSSSLLITAGEGFDNLQIGRNTLADATSKYGNFDGFCQGIACGTSPSIYTNRFVFSTQHLVVISRTEEGTKENKEHSISKLSNIVILHPLNAVTEKGIRLQTDNYKRIIQVYGKPETERNWKTGAYLHYESLGISFDCDLTNNKIKAIEIYKKGSAADLSYDGCN